MDSQTRASIIERKTRLDGSVVDYACEALVVEQGRRALVRYVAELDRPIEGTDLVLRKGTVTVGHFWTDRPYNVYHWLDGGRTVALYVSIATDTTIEPRYRLAIAKALETCVTEGRRLSAEIERETRAVLRT